MLKIPLLVLSLWCSVCNAVEAPTVVVWMKNGDKLTGTVTQQNKEILLLNVPYAGQLQLPRAHISHIESKQVPVITEAKAQAEISGAGNLPVRHSSVDLTAGKKRNSSSTDSLGFKTAFEQRDKQLRLTFDGKYDYETLNDTRKTHKYLINPGADYFFEPQLFWRNKLDYAQDFVAVDYKNADLSSGLGYSFFDTTAIRLELIALAGVKRTYFKEAAGLEIFIGDKQNLDFRHLQLEWDLRYLWPSGGYELFSEGSYLRPINQPVNYIKFLHEVTLSSGVNYYLTERIRLSFSVDFDWSKIDVVLPPNSIISADSRDLQQKLSIGAKF